MNITQSRKVHVIFAVLVVALSYLLVSPCASNNARILNATGQPIEIVMRVRNVEVWAGKMDSTQPLEVPFMHPGGEGTINLLVTLVRSKSDIGGQFGYILPYDGHGHIFLIDHRGIHYAKTFPESDFELAMAILEYIFRPFAAKIACAGPDWL